MGRIALIRDDAIRLRDMLVDGFQVHELQETLRDQLNLRDLTNSINFTDNPNRVFADALQKANAHGVLDRVVTAMVARRPYRPDLEALRLILSTRKGWGAPGPHGIQPDTTEKLLGTGKAFVAAKALGEFMIRVPHQVCQIETTDGGGGTGFLIGPDLVLTNQHVIAAAEGDLTKLKVYFGYFSEDDEGEAHTPSDEGALMSSPVHELDYAVVRLQSQPGNDTLQASQGRGGGLRGWVDLSKRPVLPTEKGLGLIVGHPQNDRPPPIQMPLAISSGAHAFEAMDPDHRRVRYRVDTKPGSSGSPVFDGDLRPVALHQRSGDPYPDSSHPQAGSLAANNTGIPLQAIFDAFSPDLRKELTASPVGP